MPAAAAFVASTLLFLPNRLPLYLSVPVLVFLAGYSYAKRFTSLAHFWLGTALALSPVAAWIAIRGESVLANPADLLPALVLGGAVLTWVAGFDIIYACQDYDSDRAAEAAQHSGAAWDSTALATGGRLPFADDRSAGLPAAGLPAAWLAVLGRRRRGRRAAGRTSTCWCGRTTFPASMRRFST